MEGVDTDSLRARLRQTLAGTAPGDPQAEAWLAGLPPEYTPKLRHLWPALHTPAAVLVPIVDHGKELTVLLTQRSADLKHHGGQISLPGGRLEPEDADATATALRETEEEIGLDRRFIEVIGYLPDHLVISGYRVTPVISFVRPGFELKLDPTEVVDTFEVPLTYVLDAVNHSSRRRKIGDTEFDVYDIPFGERNIWGATAGILITLYRTLQWP